MCFSKFLNTLINNQVERTTQTEASLRLLHMSTIMPKVRRVARPRRKPGERVEELVPIPIEVQIPQVQQLV